MITRIHECKTLGLDMKEEAGYPKLGASLLSCVCAVEKVLRIDLKIDYLFKVHDNEKRSFSQIKTIKRKRLSYCNLSRRVPVDFLKGKSF